VAATSSRKVGTRIAGALSAALVGVALTACGGDSAAEGGGDTFVLGYTATLTGEFASYGLQMRQGVDLAVEEINAAGGIGGMKVSVESVDDVGKPANGPVVAQKFCDNSAVRAVLGYSFSSVALAAIPVIEQCHIPVVASAVTSPQLSGASDYFFRTVVTDAVQGANVGTFVAQKEGRSRVAVLHQQDDYGNGLAAAFTKAVKAAGGTITSDQAYQLGTKDFQTQLDKLSKEKPEAIFIAGFYPEAVKIAQQASSAGIDLPLYGSDGLLSPDLIKLGGKDVEGVVLQGAFTPSLETPEVQDFVKRFQAKFNEEPSSWAALAYDAVQAVKVAAGTGTTREQIKDGLASLQGLDGITGDVGFDDSGDRIASAVFLKVQGGQFVAVG
jgi:branched-chain amino acid transport system substrate-binding protein